MYCLDTGDLFTLVSKNVSSYCTPEHLSDDLTAVAGTALTLVFSVDPG